MLLNFLVKVAMARSKESLKSCTPENEPKCLNILRDSFCIMLDNKINMVHTNMEQAEDQKALFRFQGQASALRKLKTLREEVNADG